MAQAPTIAAPGNRPAPAVAPPPGGLNADRTVSAAGQAALAQREGQAPGGGYYNDSANNCTYGTGLLAHTGPCTADELRRAVNTQQAQDEFQRRVDEAARRVCEQVQERRLTQNQYDSLASTVYNTRTRDNQAVLNSANQNGWTAFGSGPLTDPQRAIFDRSPALAAWQAAREARCAKIDLEQAEARERDAQARRDIRPGELIAALSARGVTLAVDGKGHITAMPGEAVTTGEIADVVEHKLAIVAILTAPAPAAPAPPPANGAGLIQHRVRRALKASMRAAERGSSSATVVDLGCKACRLLPVV